MGMRTWVCGWEGVHGFGGVGWSGKVRVVNESERRNVVRNLSGVREVRYGHGSYKKREVKRELSVLFQLT